MPTSPMTGEHIDQTLAALGFHRRWFALGVLTESWLERVERRDELPERVLGLALSEYLTKRNCLDDDIVDELLELAARADHRCAEILATWKGMTVEQLNRMIHHEAIAPQVRDSAAQWQEVRMFEQPDERNDSDLVRFVTPGTENHTYAGEFKVSSFRFPVAWRRRLAIDERRRIAAWLAVLPAGTPMRCHTPAFGLSIAAGARDECAMSICFKCSNAYYDRGASRTLDSASRPARELISFLKELRRGSAP